MAVVPDKRNALRQRLGLLKTNRQIVLDALRQLQVHCAKSPITTSNKMSFVKDVMNVEASDNFRTPTAATSSPSMMQSSPALSSSTDTASESGSAFNSPNNQQVQHQPSSADLANSTYVKDFSRLIVVKMSCQPLEKTDSRETIAEQGPVNENQSLHPLDLKALLKSLEKEIETYEILLSDEEEKQSEKRKKYLVDDRRRTWNYDDFITTFLSMLSEQQSLADLLEENTTGRKRIHRIGKESPSNRHKKGKPRYKRR